VKQQPKKQRHRYLRFTSIAIQMGLTIYLGSKLGEWLDIRFETNNQVYYKVVTLISVFIAMFSIIQQVLKITNQDQKNNKK
jgi:hypothetical protein